MNNEVALNILVEKVTSIESNLSVLTNAGLCFLGLIVATIVCFILYKAVSNFLNF